MALAIETVGLHKTYHGDVQALIDLDMTVEMGEVYGLLGPNGAGKTTLIRILLDLIAPSAGHALLLGLDARTTGAAARTHVGYLPGDARLAPRLTGRQQLESFARMSGGLSGARIEPLAERFSALLDRPIRELSRGNRQKIALIQAFMHDPQLVLLDEPTSGLDPLVQEEFRRLVRETAGNGRTVFLSSHSLDEVQHVAHRVGIIRAGRLAAVESVEGLLARSVRHVVVTFTAPVDPAAFAQLDSVQGVHADGRVLRCSVRGSMDALLKELARHDVLDFTSTPADLEEIFLGFYRASGGTPDV